MTRLTYLMLTRAALLGVLYLSGPPPARPQAFTPALSQRVFRLTEQRVIPENTTYTLAAGLYRNTVPGPAFVLSDGATLRCAPGAVIEESTAAANEYGVNPTPGPTGGQSVFTIVQDRAGSRRNGTPSRGITVEGCTFRGARKDFNSALQTVSLGNCKGCKITRNRFERVRTIAAQIGGGSMEGHYAENSEISDNEFTGSASQNAAITNCVNCRVIRNRFIAPGIPGGPGTTVIDVEPNDGDIIDDILIADNLIDARDAPIAGRGEGPKVTNGIAVNGANRVKLFRNVRVLRNTILGARHDDIHNHVSWAGILFQSAAHSSAEENTVVRVRWGIQVRDSSHHLKITRNRLIATGAQSNASFEAVGLSHSEIRDNLIRDEPGDVLKLGRNAEGFSVSPPDGTNKGGNNGPGVQLPTGNE